MNLDLHVWTTRDGSYRARCTGTVDGRQVTARSREFLDPCHAAVAAIGLWEWGPPRSPRLSPAPGSTAAPAPRTDSAEVGRCSGSSSTLSATTPSPDHQNEALGVDARVEAAAAAAGEGAVSSEAPETEQVAHTATLPTPIPSAEVR